MQISCYLIFNGNCSEAMTFYKDCFGGELTIEYLGHTPEAKDLPEQMRSYVLHALLQNDNLILMGSDMVSDDGYRKGNTVSLSFNCHSETATKNYYTKLSMGGEACHALKVNYWGILHGDLIDRYGQHWILSCANPNIKHKIK